MKQKKHVQYLVKEEISIHEKKITEEIKHSTNKRKALWENIGKLRKKERKSRGNKLVQEWRETEGKGRKDGDS